ncbi:MAG: histone deacetylase [Peptococcaceae bacterium]|jgi:acetoin utilization deacetylase AcuC-like enzyme|nr:histone deacetylase [Peptococcaceae bacterium]
MKKTALMFFPAFDWSLGSTHPEREERLLYTQEQLFEEGVMDLPQIVQLNPIVAPLKAVCRTQAIFPSSEEQDLEAHRIAAGSALVMGDAWARQEIHNGFALVRPPGHHAGAVVWGNRGFCTLNNEAILINHLRSQYGYRKIAVVDTDVHHGDGTQNIFWHDPNVLFISLHQDGRTLYPGSGFVDELGGVNAWGQTLNIPMPPGTGDDGYLYMLEHWVLPKLQEFQPDVVINSAGQDNHYSDPLARMNVSARGYGQITELVRPDIAVLEGGYSIETALPYVNLAILLALAGEDYSQVQEPSNRRHTDVSLKDFKQYYQDLRAKQESQRVTWDKERVKHLLNQEWAHEDYSVYYDTEGFQETRQEYVRPCAYCGGTVVIMSKVRLHSDVCVLVRIPFLACETCRRTGLDVWQSLSERSQESHRYGSILLQNQADDDIRLWKRYEGVTKF